MATALLADVAGTKPAGRIGNQWLASVWRWATIAAGALILVAGPAVWAVLDSVTSRQTAGWIVAIVFGCAMASAIVPSIVLAICATLSWRPAWQRFLLFAPALAMQAAAYFAFWCDHPPSSRDLAPLWISPLVVIAAAMPTFMLRLWRQWMIVPPGSNAQPRPASIASLLLVTTLWAAAAACTQWIDATPWFSDPALKASGFEPIAKLVTVVIFALTPAAFMGLALVLSLRAALMRRPAAAFCAAAAVAVPTLAVPTASLMLFQHLVNFQVNDRPIANGELLAAAIGVGSFCLTTLAIGFASFFVLRLLGYRLVHRGTLLQSS
jgi:hypothetical protein